MQVRIRTNLLEFEIAPNLLEFVDPPEFEFEIQNFKFLYRIHFPVPTAGCFYFSETKNDHHAGLLLTCYYLAYSESLWVNMIHWNQGKWSPLI